MGLADRHPAIQTGWRLLDPLPPTVPTGWAEFDEALGGGVPRGDAVEVVSEGPGAGALTLALALGRRLLEGAEAPGRVLVLVDPEAGAVLPGRHWPQAAGVRVRPRSARQTLGVLDRALRCPAVAAAVARLPRGRAGRIDLATSMRLRQAARIGGGTCFLLRDGRAAASAAGVRLRVRRRGCPGATEPFAVEVLRVRGGPGTEGALALEV